MGLESSDSSKGAASSSPARRIVILLLIGAVGGFLSGAFGVGGGIVMVPLLLWFTSLNQRQAAATSLVAIVPTSIAGSLSYLANGEVEPLAALLLAVGGIGGALIGTKLLRTLPLGWLRWMFIILLLAVAVRLLFEVPERGTHIEVTLGVGLALLGLGLVMGIASGLFGIGGGIIMVPVLVGLFGASDLVAKGTSLLAIIPTAVTGSVSNWRAGLVRVRDGLVMGIAATVAAVGGVAVAFVMPPQVAAVLFAVLIAAAVGQLVWRDLRGRRAVR
ncbi:MAG TPA: sulfite exporter TauE/SafE family protein [Pseudolysinimonas sp.]|nr:sulfite exporter TauE/SafE family protein [Pseudolysinimonas sp.]